MLKKRLLLSLAVVSMFGLTGCASSIRLTENENNIVAEYLAGVLLSQQRSYDQALIEPSPTPTPVPTVTPTPTSPEKPSTVSNKGNNSGYQTGSNVQANADFTEVIGNNNRIHWL